ncbi:MAG: cation-translocating P-type ATPase [Candidatus Micrarchaeota archaeon]
MPEAFFSKTADQIRSELSADFEKGLSALEAKERQNRFGLNKLAEKKGVSLGQMFKSQFSDAVVWILIFAGIVSGIIGDFLEAFVIVVLVIINAALGVRQEFKAEKAMQALQRLAASKATVIRNKSEEQIDASDLVPGDIVILETGCRVPADLRLFEAVNLQIAEASLTGESNPVTKKTAELSENTSLADQKNMAFMNTEVTYGRGKGIVVATGMKTEFGKIAGLIQGIKQEKTPLAKKMEELGGVLAKIVIGIAVIIFILELWEQTVTNGFSWNQIPIKVLVDLLLVSVALAVAAVPEGLPAVVTITLSNGMTTMAKNNAIMRKMAAVETLGSTSVICSDKTGTLTKNEMVVRTIWLDNRRFGVGGVGYAPIGEITAENSAEKNRKSASDLLDSKNFLALFENCLLCNNSQFDSQNRQWIGDPTEVAFKVLAKKGKVNETQLLQKMKFAAEVPFESDRKRMSVVYQNTETGKTAVYAKGSCESILSISSFLMENDKIVSLTDAKKKELLQKNDELASTGLRVLGFAYKELNENEMQKNRTKNSANSSNSNSDNSLAAEKIESKLVFLGLVGMIDAPREGVKESIAKCHAAGIEVKMITGDHKLTALAIAKEIGLYKQGLLAVTGEELEQWSDQELEEKIEFVAVIARVNASDKMRIVSALQKNGHVVAMTGDGINDAPALKKADIGIAMGITGTDVSKEASVMVIQDDHFATIVKAVEEGRRVFDNIRAFVRYLLSANTAEVMAVFAAILAGWPVPLLPLHLLWINLLTDGLPALALGNEKKDPDSMKRKPRSPKAKITDGMLAGIVIAGVVGMVVTLFAFQAGFFAGGIEKGRTMAFAAIILFELFWVFECKNINRTVFNSNLFDNRSLNLAVLASIVLLIAAVQIPLFNTLLNTVPLQANDWILVAVLALPAIFIEAGYNWITRRNRNPKVSLAV